ncbi:DUF2550 domain-containing protein [Micrococcales bacterium 31B]|nr:DUF2550 domain-containing protein [Micrococcales bacterium 31B]
MMSTIMWILVVAALCIGAVAIALILRRRALSRAPGSFECALKFHANDHWHNGVARFHIDRIEWYRSLNLSPRPQRTWPRREFEITARDALPEGIPELSAVPAFKVTCAWGEGGATLELALGQGDLHALSSWSESAPPGASGPLGSHL